MEWVSRKVSMRGFDEGVDGGLEWVSTRVSMRVLMRV